MRRSRRYPLSNRRSAALPAGKTGARKGSTIVVVIALLLALTFLGIVGYTIGTQEHSNAVYFSDASKDIAYGVSREDLFAWSLRQIILGTRQHEERQSALHGGHMSLLATMFGNDRIAFNGYGTHVAIDPATNTIFPDQNYNGTDDPLASGRDPDGSEALLQINRAPFARGPGGVIPSQIGTPAFSTQADAEYQAPDVGYSYWDINNPALAYVKEGHVYNSSGNTMAGGIPFRVALPSYHRPQYLRDLAEAKDWYSDPNTARYVLRPHRDHFAVASNGVVTPTRRFIYPGEGTTEEAQIGAFPFAANTNDPSADDINDGVWDPEPLAMVDPMDPMSPTFTSFENHRNMQYDADPDNDGFNEAIWMDLGYPMQVRENADGTVTKFVPMFAITLYDADALFNLNAHGNVAGVRNFTSATDEFGFLDPGPDGTYGNANDFLDFISRSNQGVAASHVNPQWGLTAAVGDGDTTQHQQYLTGYGRDLGANPLTKRRELANLEWWFLVSGRADLDTSNNIDKLYPGRNGEVDQLNTALSNVASGFSVYPKPGQTGVDDNFDDQLGSVYQAAGLYFPTNVNDHNNNSISFWFRAWDQPLDWHGGGRMIDRKPTSDNLYGRSRFTNTIGQHRWPAYEGYSNSREIDLYAYNFSTATGAGRTSVRNTLFPRYNERFKVDEPEESILEPDYTRSDLDWVFGVGETAALHIPQGDQDALGISGRVRELAPVNFNSTDNQALTEATEARRRLFTSISWDLKSYSTARYITTTGGTPDPTEAPIPTLARNHEADTVDFSTHTSLRPAIQWLLRERAFNTATNSSDTYHRGKLSLNHLCIVNNQGTAAIDDDTVEFRPLTPHPTALGSDEVDGRTTMTAGDAMTPASRPIEIVTVYDQEWFARRDRQQLCRDIYSLLYLYCGGDDTINYSTATSNTSTSTAYPVNSTTDKDNDGVNDQLQEMAQFAVNLVDRMDTDNVITRFEYDTDLSDGWGMDDNPYTTGETGRQEVFGVEQQLLTLNEAQIILAKRVRDTADPSNTPTNHKATEYDDEKHRDWTFLELSNVSPEDVRLNNNWQIVLEADPDQTGGVSIGMEERRLTLRSRTVTSAANGSNGLFTIGTAGDKDNHGAENNQQTPIADPPDPVASHFRVSKDHGDTNDPKPFEVDGFDEEADYDMDGDAKDFQIAPRGNLDMDLLDGAYSGQFSVHTGDLPGGSLNGTDLFRYAEDEHLGSRPNPDSIDGLSSGDKIYYRVRLRRRLHLDRSAPTSAAESDDNPWIDVDVLKTIDTAGANPVAIDIFALEKDDDFDEIRDKLRALRSSQRTRPLWASTLHDYIGTSIKANDLGSLNQNSTTNIPELHYQPHFDRDFGSAMELLSVPLYGPEKLTTNLENSNGSNSRLIASGNVLSPQATTDPMTMAVTTAANRWYRLFEFVEVPDWSHRHPQADVNNIVRPMNVIPLGNLSNEHDPNNTTYLTNNGPEAIYRRPGRIQLNTLRDPEVLGGLLDDPEVALLDLSSASEHLPDQGIGTGSGTVRDWWVELLRARDGIDPVTNLILPGVPDGGRDAMTGQQYGSRPFRPYNFTHKGDNSLENTLFRQLPMDVSATSPRSLFELGNSNGNPQIDHSIRYRMLEKVANNSTTRSNVFLIFIQVDFFQAVEVRDTTTSQNVVRVGAKLSDSPAYRGFFVVDRSKARYLLAPGDEPQSRVFTDIDSIDKQNYSFNPHLDYNQLILHRQTIN